MTTPVAGKQLSSPRALPGVPAPSRMSVPRLLHNGLANGEDHDLYCWTKSRPRQGKATPCPRKPLSRTAFSGRFADDRIFVDLDRVDYDLFWMSMNGEESAPDVMPVDGQEQQWRCPVLIYPINNSLIVSYCIYRVLWRSG